LSDGKALIDIMEDHGLEQLVNFPTRLNNTLDLILTSLPGMICNVSSIDKFSDHDTIACELKVNISAKRCPRRNFFFTAKGIMIL